MVFSAFGVEIYVGNLFKFTEKSNRDSTEGGAVEIAHLLPQVVLIS